MALSYLLGRIGVMARNDRIDRDDALTRVELARVEGAVTALTSTVAAHQTAVSGRLDDFERRIRINEAWRLSIPPAAVFSVVSLIITLFHH